MLQIYKNINQLELISCMPSGNVYKIALSIKFTRGVQQFLVKPTLLTNGQLHFQGSTQHDSDDFKALIEPMRQRGHRRSLTLDTWSKGSFL